MNLYGLRTMFRRDEVTMAEYNTRGFNKKQNIKEYKNNIRMKLRN
jgi:hypothetical protein